MWNGLSVKVPGGGVTESDANRLLEKALAMASHKVLDYVSSKVAAELAHQAVAHRTKDSSILAALIASVSSILAGKAVLKRKTGSRYRYIPGVNLLSIAYTGSGKTQGLRTFCVELLSRIEALLGRTILGFPANYSNLRKFLAENNGIGTVATDEMGRFLMKETGNSLASDMIPLMNLMYSGSALKLEFTKAKSINVESSCVTVCGTLHATWAVNLLRAWSGGEGFVDRWMFTASDNDIADAEECDNANDVGERRHNAADIYGMFMMLAVQMQANENIVEYVMSDEALQCFYAFSRQTRKKHSNLREQFKQDKNTSMESLDSKIEENCNRVALALHVLDHGLVSHAETGRVEIPLKLSADSWKRGLLYVTTSIRVAEILLERDHEYGAERGLISVASPFLFPRLIGEAHSYRNLPAYSEKDEFQKCAKKLESLGLGKVLEVCAPKTARNHDGERNGGSSSYCVLFKIPPLQVSEDKLQKIGLTKTEHASSYDAPPRVSPSHRTVLRETLAYIAKMNPFTAETRVVPEAVTPTSVDAQTPYISNYEAEPEAHKTWSPVSRRSQEFSDEEYSVVGRNTAAPKRQKIDHYDVSDDELF